MRPGLQNTVESIAIDSDDNTYLGLNTLKAHSLVKYSANGNRLWELPVTDLSTYYACFNIALSSDNSTLSVSGNYNQATQYGNLTLVPNHEGDAYLARLDASEIVSSPLKASTNIHLTYVTGSSAHVSWQSGDGTRRLVLLKKLGHVRTINIVPKMQSKESNSHRLINSWIAP